jgi:hypothetical protein
MVRYEFYIRMPYQYFISRFLTITSAHWPPFVRAAIEYIHKEYPEPWADRQEEATVGILNLLYSFFSVSFSLYL